MIKKFLEYNSYSKEISLEEAEKLINLRGSLIFTRREKDDIKELVEKYELRITTSKENLFIKKDQQTPITVIKCGDEWYVIMLTLARKTLYYKCDQFDSLLKNKINN